MLKGKLTLVRKKCTPEDTFYVGVGADDGVSRGEAFLAPVYPPCPRLPRPHLGAARDVRDEANIGRVGATWEARSALEPCREAV